MPPDFTGLVGIDLGTTFSCVARLSRDGIPQTIPNREGDLTTPSVVLFDDGLAIIGREAKRSACVDPLRAAICVKRDMGLERYTSPVAGESFRPEVLSALILKRLRADVEGRFGPIRDAVITVPAYFDDVRRQATQDAGRIAGLHVLDIINEPTAAALAFAFDAHLRRSASHPANAGEFLQPGSLPGQTVLVFDLGGGTFDVSVVRMSAERFETLATEGDVRLGGRDWDELLVRHLAREFLREHGTDPLSDPESTAFLFQAAEDAKIALSARSSTRVLVTHAARRMSIELTRDQFDRLTTGLVLRTRITTELVLESAGLTWNQIDRVLLVGGMTRVPHVREMIRRLTGREPDCSLAADEVVAHGAAIHGGILLARRGSPGDSPLLQTFSRFQTIDVNSHSLGIAVRTPQGYANSILIPKNTQLPVACSRTYYTSSPNQRQVRVRVLEGEAREAEACVPIGEFILQGLPPHLPERSPIEVECRYGTDGRVSVVGRDPASGLLAETTIERHGQLQTGELEQARLRVDELPVV